jgi:peptide deformylase
MVVVHVSVGGGAGRRSTPLRDTGAVDITELTRKILDRRAKEGDPLRIVQAGHPALRRPGVAARDRLEIPLLAELADAMTTTMREAPGVGLAAPQVGLPLRFYVVEDRFAADAQDEDPHDALLERRPLPLRALLDPVVEPLGTQRVYAFEGCLSVDGWQSIVPRSRRVRLRATELLPGGELREVDEEHVGWTARILQHETDHLAGILCHDTMVPRSFIEAGYTAHYAELPEAVRRLGLTGEITRLGAGEVIVDDAP